MHLFALSIKQVCVRRSTSRRRAAISCKSAAMAGGVQPQEPDIDMLMLKGIKAVECLEELTIQSELCKKRS